MAALGGVFNFDMASAGLRLVIAQRASWQACIVLHTQTAKRRSVPDLRLYTRWTYFPARAYLWGLAAQSPSLYFLRLIHSRHGNANLFRAGCKNPLDSHRAHNCLDSGPCAVFCQLGIRYRVCEVTFGPGVLSRISPPSNPCGLTRRASECNFVSCIS